MSRPDSEATGAEFDWEWSFGFLGARAVTGVEVATGRTYRRLASGPGGEPVEYGFSARGGGVALRATPPLSLAVRSAVSRHWFDLDRDLRPFHRLADVDRLLGPLVRGRPGIRIPGRFDPFEIAVRAIVGQLISVAAATTILGRLAATFAAPVGGGPGLTRLFPSPEELAAPTPGRIAVLGLTKAKAVAIRTLARDVCDGRLSFGRIGALPAEEADRVLRAQPGIGPWTAGYLRLRGLGDPDVALDTDLGIAKALVGLGLPRARHRAAVDRWSPWRSYAMLHLWASLG